MSNAARGRAPAHLDPHMIWSKLDAASLALAHLEGGVQALLLASTSRHVDLETRDALQFIRLAMTGHLHDLHEQISDASQAAHAACGFVGSAA